MIYKLHAIQKGRKRFEICVDEEDYLRYRGKRLRRLSDGRVYFYSHGKRNYLHREIFNLTKVWDRVFFKSSNRQDMRKSNLALVSVPEANRGKYSVQFPKHGNIKLGQFA